MSKTSSLIFYTLLACFITASAQAKYCVRLPSCEELGYVFDYSTAVTTGRRHIVCPFSNILTDEGKNVAKVLLLDYCQGYGLTEGQCNPANGDCEQCAERKANGQIVSAPYYRYVRCKGGFVYQDGDCVAANP